MAQRLLLCCRDRAGAPPHPETPHLPPPGPSTAWPGAVGAAQAPRVVSAHLPEEPRPGTLSPEAHTLSPPGLESSISGSSTGSSRRGRRGAGGGGQGGSALPSCDQWLLALRRELSQAVTEEHLQGGLVSFPQATLISTWSPHGLCQWVRMGSQRLARRGPGIWSPQATTSLCSSLRSEARGTGLRPTSSLEAEGADR